MTANAVQRAVPDISFLLSHASYVLATGLTEALQEIGLTPRGHCVLMYALPGELPRSSWPGSGLDKTTMVVTLDELEEAGYAERVPSHRPAGPAGPGDRAGHADHREASRRERQAIGHLEHEPALAAVAAARERGFGVENPNPEEVASCGDADLSRVVDQEGQHLVHRASWCSCGLLQIDTAQNSQSER